MTREKLTLILLVASVIMLVMISRIQRDQTQQETNQEQQLPNGAVGINDKGGYIYRADFIGALNKLDTRADD